LPASGTSALIPNSKSLPTERRNTNAGKMPALQQMAGKMPALRQTADIMRIAVFLLRSGVNSSKCSQAAAPEFHNRRIMFSMKKTTPPRKGLLAGGNWIIDQVKLIDVYPQPEQLANIRSQSEGTGGAPYNVLVNLAKLGASFPLAGAGLVGKDALGQRILQSCKELRIDARQLQVTTEAPTSYTDVMTEIGHGRRTFFHNRGANALWDGKDLDFEKTKARIFHLGYLLLLDALDGPDKKYGTKAARLLDKARRAGLKTSVDVVSEDSDRFSRIVTPSLQYTDYCILNELEAGRTTGFTIRQPDGKLDTVALRHAAGALLQKGVRELVVIHFPEGGFARTRKGDDFWQSSLDLPSKYVAGTAGAGDAFCAGVLLGLHENWELSRCLMAGVCVAAASLSNPTCTGGVKSIQNALDLGKKYRFRPSLIPGD
jgi:sugar/nucleoside kinase (ribokinase family)